MDSCPCYSSQRRLSNSRDSYLLTVGVRCLLISPLQHEEGGDIDPHSLDHRVPCARSVIRVIFKAHIVSSGLSQPP